VKLLIQIPSYNEEAFLPLTIQALPRHIAGIDVIETLVVDDGSTDSTSQAAQGLGVNHVVRLPRHVGLAGAFMAGLEACLLRGADIIVNTDADNQYRADDIPRLVEPILKGQAHLVIGDRAPASLLEFSWTKRWLQWLGSLVVAQASGVPTPDAASGFRALSREAALRTIVLSDYSYTLETLIQAGARQMAVAYVPVRTNPTSRRSRLVRSLPQYVFLSAATIVRAYALYRPLRVFFGIGGLMIAGGAALGLRFLYYYSIGSGTGHIQSLILAAILLIVGFQVCLIGVLADLIGFNRKMIEETLFRVRRLELDRDPPASPVALDADGSTSE
jgi:glycosyltransferase involved in cell wall biosynthesis